MNNFEFFAQICPKKDLGLETEKSNAWNKNQHCRDTLYANFQPNWTTLMDLGFEIQKTNVGTRINNLETTCVPIFRQNKQL